MSVHARTRSPYSVGGLCIVSVIPYAHCFCVSAAQTHINKNLWIWNVRLKVIFEVYLPRVTAVYECSYHCKPEFGCDCPVSILVHPHKANRLLV